MPVLEYNGKPVRLSYCANVAPVTSIQTLEASFEAIWSPVRRNLGMRPPMGVGLWLPAPVMAELAADVERVYALRRKMADCGLFTVTLNAFPFDHFHAERVKEAVYKPAWFKTERLRYTLDAARVMSALLPDNHNVGTISTLPLAWWPHFEAAGGEALMAGANLFDLAAQLAELEAQTGKCIRVLLEPEPGCVLDRTDDAVSYLLDLGAGHSLSERFDRHLGVCFDCCHQAVMGEDLPASLRLLFDSGVRVGKIHLSAAVEGVLETLQPFVEPRYLHQSRLADGSGPMLDLEAALGRDDWAGKQVRTHFHVPVHMAELAGGVRTTAALLPAVLDEVLRWPEVPDLEIETYTWSVMPGAEVPLVDGIGAEMRHVLDLLAARGVR